MQGSPPRPPYGTYSDELSSMPEQDQLFNSRPDRKTNSIQSAMLSERNIVLDEILQTKKDAKLIQSESRRGQEETQRRMSVLESRLNAFEALTRTLDRKSSSCENLMLKLQNDFDLRLREIESEGSRRRRDEEMALRALIESVSPCAFQHCARGKWPSRGRFGAR